VALRLLVLLEFFNFKDDGLPTTDGIWKIAPLRFAAQRLRVVRRAMAAVASRRQVARQPYPLVANDEGGLEPGALLLQQVCRVRAGDGTESIHGTALAEFAAGQREASVYVAFCPPFEVLPEVEADISDDSTATVKLAQRLHHGSHFDVRLTEPAEHPLTVSIEFSAVGINVS
jgi:hypothetical protein